MTLTTLSPKQPDSIVNRKSHYPSKNDKKGRIVFFQRKKEKNALKSKKKWFRWHFSPLQKAKIRGVKGRIKGGKTRNFLIYFIKILAKQQEKLGQSEGVSVRFNSIKRGNQNSSTSYYQIDYQYNTIKTASFRITFRSSIGSNRVKVKSGHFEKCECHFEPQYNINKFILYYI